MIFAERPSVVISIVEVKLLTGNDGKFIFQASDKTDLDANHHAIPETVGGGCRSSCRTSAGARTGDRCILAEVLGVLLIVCVSWIGILRVLIHGVRGPGGVVGG